MNAAILRALNKAVPETPAAAIQEANEQILARAHQLNESKWLKNPRDFALRMFRSVPLGRARGKAGEFARQKTADAKEWLKNASYGDLALRATAGGIGGVAAAGIALSMQDQETLAEMLEDPDVPDEFKEKIYRVLRGGL